MYVRLWPFKGDDGAYPVALMFDSTTDKVYCANTGSDDVTVIDCAVDSIITTIPVGDQPTALACNPFQNRTYVANVSSSSVSVIRDSLTGIAEDHFRFTMSFRCRVAGRTLWITSLRFASTITA